MGNTITGTAQAETLDATARALWEALAMPGGVGREVRDDLMWHIGRLAGLLVVADGSHHYGVAGVPLNEGLVGQVVTEARQAMDYAKRTPYGVHPGEEW